MRVVATMRGCREDINENNGEESVKMKMSRLENKKAYR